MSNGELTVEDPIIIKGISPDGGISITYPNKSFDSRFNDTTGNSMVVYNVNSSQANLSISLLSNSDSFISLQKYANATDGQNIIYYFDISFSHDIKLANGNVISAGQVTKDAVIEQRIDETFASNDGNQVAIRTVTFLCSSLA